MLRMSPKEVSVLVAEARQRQHLSYAQVARRTGTSLALVHRTEKYGSRSAARVVSLLVGLGFEIRQRDGTVTMSLEHARAIRRLIKTLRQAAATDRLPLKVEEALDEFRRNQAGAVLVRAIEECAEEPAHLQVVAS